MLTCAQVLALVPQQRPMRFVDELLEIDEEHILGAYVWREEDCLGSACGLVPPFKLIEMAAQIGNVCWGLWFMSRQMPIEEIRGMTGFFTEIDSAELTTPVYAGDRLLCQATFDEGGYFRANKISARAEIQFDAGPDEGLTAFSGKLSGLWIPQNPI